MRVKDVIAILQSFNQEAELRIIPDSREDAPSFQNGRPLQKASGRAW